MDTEALRIVALIPARGGSKSIPMKNLALLGGKPLLAWAIDVARQVDAIDRVFVSTDHAEIARVATEFGAEVSARPPHLATDTSLVIDTIRDFLAQLAAAGETPRTLVMLEPTCPLRSADDIERCLALLEDDGIDSVATFKPAELNPLRAWRIEGHRPETFLPDVVPWLPRQQLPPAYQLNGAVFALRADRLCAEHEAVLFGNAAAVVMPPERSVDIDHAVDLLVAEAVLAGSHIR